MTKPKRAVGVKHGVSRCAAGRSDVGSLSSTQIPVQFIATLPPLTTSLGDFCHYCCDVCDPTLAHTCVDCAAVVCEQALPGLGGCIGHKSVNRSHIFQCPLCARKGAGKTECLPYKFVGFGTRKKLKKTWPVCVVHLVLDSLKDDYLKRLINIELVNQYSAQQGNVSYHRIPANPCWILYNSAVYRNP
jgi:hypothetical protein